MDGRSVGLPERKRTDVQACTEGCCNAYHAISSTSLVESSEKLSQAHFPGKEYWSDPRNVGILSPVMNDVVGFGPAPVDANNNRTRFISPPHERANPFDDEPTRFFALLATHEDMRAHAVKPPPDGMFEIYAIHDRSRPVAYVVHHIPAPDEHLEGRTVIWQAHRVFSFLDIELPFVHVEAHHHDTPEEEHDHLDPDARKPLGRIPLEGQTQASERETDDGSTDQHVHSHEEGPRQENRVRNDSRENLRDHGKSPV